MSMPCNTHQGGICNCDAICDVNYSVSHVIICIWDLWWYERVLKVFNSTQCSREHWSTMKRAFIISVLLLVAYAKNRNRFLTPSISISSEDVIGNAIVRILAEFNESQTLTINILTISTCKNLERLIDKIVSHVLLKADDHITFRMIRVERYMEADLTKRIPIRGEIFWVLINGYDRFR